MVDVLLETGLAIVDRPNKVSTCSALHHHTCALKLVPRAIRERDKCPQERVARALWYANESTCSLQVGYSATMLASLAEVGNDADIPSIKRLLEAGNCNGQVNEVLSRLA